MPSRKSAIAQTVYQLKITLKHSKPPIWRRVQVLNTTTLHQLHQVIQLTMGWTNSHLYQFTINGVDYGQPIAEYDFKPCNDKTIKLDRLITSEKFKFHYTYDMGDDWEHEILVEKILPREADNHYPSCLTGKRACPPEDCGGVWGYSEFIVAIQDPDHPEHEQMLDWVGGRFDPNEFDINEVNQLLPVIK
ncbi:plasmid pRiA4b ORF-3 family protein (plasmid) [Pseudanabaena biceps]|nr:plasmid pRiA4b ORF-3 family protein [Pseudanabaena biceps]